MRYSTGIFFIAASTLLLEISLSRIFSVLFFHHFAFLIISTALFGFGFSGVYLFFRKPAPEKLDRNLGIAAILFGLSTLIIYRILLIMPAQSEEMMQRPESIIRLLLNYALLAIPFYFSGYVISAILTSFPKYSGKLYAYDLIGAALGCLSVLWLIPELGASGAVVLASLIAGISAMIFARRKKIILLCAVGFVIGCLLLIPQAEKFFTFPIKGIVESKYPGRQVRTEKPEFSAWSPISRIDVYPTSSANKIMLLDGGSNVSSMTPFNGDLSALKPRYNWRVVPFVISRRSTACIIGPGGGEDVLNALSFQTLSIDAVEMDPLIVKLVQGRYRNFIGEVFNQPGVSTVNDEGRSFLRRSKKQYDLIQQVHNISPIAIASGALNLSESYLLTKEAFQEYWDHLKPEGMLAINRWGVVRAASIASQVLQANGVHDPENYAIVTSRQKSGTDISFYLKKGKIADNDLKKLSEFSNALGIRIDYAPHPSYQTDRNVYYRLLSIQSRDAFIKEADIDLSAPTDDRPFFDHIQKLGSFQQSSSVVPNEINRVLRFLNRGDMALFTLLGEAAVLSSLFILIPVVRFAKHNSAISRWAVLAYFSSLGLGFILIEISLIQKHILFLGQPVYSIISVLFSVLLSSGVGSYLFERYFREGSERFWLAFVPIILGTLLLLELLIMPFVFHIFLGSSKVIRFCISALLIAPLGIFLGMPFPLGIRILGMRAPEIIPWGWALNAYATVIGSILAVMFAILLGFRMNFAIAFLTYTIGFLFLVNSIKQNDKNLSKLH
jgi:spermidine synthase